MRGPVNDSPRRRGALVAVGAQDVEVEAAQAGEVFGRMVLACTGAVLVEDDVEQPVQAALDLPMGAHHGEEAAAASGRDST